MKRLLISLVAALLVFSSCGGSEPAAPSTTGSPASTTTLEMPTTTRAPVATTTTTPTTTGPPIAPPTAHPALLIADDGGIRIIENGATVTTFLTGESAVLAVPDLRGGVVYQGEPNTVDALVYDPATGRNVYVWQEGGPDPILWIAAPGAVPKPVVTHQDAKLALVDVVEIEGRPQVLYRMLIGGPAGDEAWLQVVEWLCLYDLETDATHMLGLIGSYESSRTQLRAGGSLVAVGFDEYADGEGTEVGFIALERLARRVDYNWLPLLTTDRRPYGPATECTPEGGCNGWAIVTAADDGSRLAWIEGGTEYVTGGMRNLPIEVVTVAGWSGVETMRLGLGTPPPGDDPIEPAWFVDDDGENIVVSGIGHDRAVVSITAGAATILEHNGATASLWQTSITSHTDGIDKETPLVLRGDNLGILPFGTPTDAAMEELTVQIGPPSRHFFDMYNSYAWDDLGLTVVFNSADAYREDGVEHMAGWGHWGSTVSPLRTGQGIGMGDTMAALLAAHGDQVTVPDSAVECMPTHYVWLNDPGADKTRRVMIAFTGPLDDPDSVIRYMSAGASYGC